MDKKVLYPIIYTIGGAVLAVTFAVAVFNSGEEEIVREEVRQDRSTGSAAVAKSNVESYREQLTQRATEAITERATEATTEKPVQQQAAVQAPEPEPSYSLFEEGQEMSWPVEGRILMDYSVETAVYDKSLDQYRTNDSICIAAAADTQVQAAADGIVEAVFNDRVNGNSVVLAHGNGWTTTYGQLREDIPVTEGEVVCEGDVIGRVGTPTGYGEALGTHLDFTVSRDNTTVDPKEILKSQE